MGLILSAWVWEMAGDLLYCACCAASAGPEDWGGNIIMSNFHDK